MLYSVGLLDGRQAGSQQAGSPDGLRGHKPHRQSASQDVWWHTNLKSELSGS